MGRCIAIETARARRALRNASAPSVTTRIVRSKTSGARVNGARSAIPCSLCGWLWSAIKKTLAGAHAGTEGQTRAATPARSLMPMNRNKNDGLTGYDDATSPHTF